MPSRTPLGVQAQVLSELFAQSGLDHPLGGGWEMAPSDVAIRFGGCVATALALTRCGAQAGGPPPHALYDSHQIDLTGRLRASLRLCLTCQRMVVLAGALALHDVADGQALRKKGRDFALRGREAEILRDETRRSMRAWSPWFNGKNEGSHPRGPKVGWWVLHRRHVQRHRRRPALFVAPPSCRPRPKRPGGVSARATKPLEHGVVLGRRGTERSVLVREHIALAKQRQGAVVRCNDPPMPVELNDARTGVLEKLPERGREGAGLDQRDAHAHEVTNVRQ